jgi:DNA-binding NarL/FixJ family response regulator
MKTIKLIIVDDHFVVRSGLVASLELEDDLKVVAEADSGHELPALYQSKTPDLVLLDLQLPGSSGIEVSKALRATYPDARILIFSTFARDEEIAAALAAGALGYLPKSASRDELLRAIRTVATGQRYLSAQIEATLARRRTEPEITTREREILTRVAQGMANKEIAADLGIAEDTVKRHVSSILDKLQDTVKRHVSSILDKLQVNDRAQATAEGIRRGLVKEQH